MPLPLRSSMECLSGAETGPQPKLNGKLRGEQVLQGKRAAAKANNFSCGRVSQIALAGKLPGTIGWLASCEISQVASRRGDDAQESELGHAMAGRGFLPYGRRPSEARSGTVASGSACPTRRSQLLSLFRMVERSHRACALGRDTAGD